MMDIISIIFTDTQVNECFSISQAEANQFIYCSQ